MLRMMSRMARMTIMKMMIGCSCRDLSSKTAGGKAGMVKLRRR